jgi:UDP-N-acetylmuramoyl-tripeptide--D-alanyl-D-alanine ligase
LEPGNLYVALKGERFDGHRFVGDAFAAGACGALVNRGCGLSASPARRLLTVDDAGRALLALGRGYSNRIKPHVIGVTGSVGKTTVKEMIADVLQSRMPTARSVGNWNNNIGLPLSLLRMPADTRAGVFELGSNHPGEIRMLSEILRPRWGVVTLIGPAHIEFLGSVAGVAEEKADLLRALPEDGLAFLNRETEYYEVLVDAAPCPVVTVSMGGTADYSCTAYDSARRCAIIHDTRSGEEHSVGGSSLARHDVTNAMLAIAVARAMGVEWELICQVLEDFRPLPMRWQAATIGGIRVVNDAYNANPLSMRAAITSFAELQNEGERWLLLGDMLEIGESAADEHVALGTFLARGAWGGVILVGLHAGEIAEGAVAAGLPEDRVFVCEDKTVAGAIVTKHVGPGDALLVKASRGIGLESVINAFRLREEGILSDD